MDARRELISDRLKAHVAVADEIVREKLTEEVRERLISTLMDGTVFSIVQSLSDLQRLKENELYQERENLLRIARGSPDFDSKTAEVDRKILRQLDEVVKEQQSTLCCTGVPLFNVTDDPRDLTVQCSIVKFIQSLRPVYA